MTPSDLVAPQTWFSSKWPWVMWLYADRPRGPVASWSSPQNLPPGTYTFYCRIHPFMRGVFQIIK